MFCTSVTTRNVSRRVAAVVWLLLFAGCQNDALTLVPVRGNVALGDRQANSGFVSFRADAKQGNKTLHIPTGKINAEGQYELFTNGQVGAPPGWYKVLVFIDANQQQGTVHPLRPEWLMDEKYTREETTDLRVNVVVAASAPYDLKLE
jgi:hypothetical protein